MLLIIFYSNNQVTSQDIYEYHCNTMTQCLMVNQAIRVGSSHCSYANTGNQPVDIANQVCQEAKHCVLDSLQL